MKFFRRTTIDTNEFGTVKDTKEVIVETENDGSVDTVLDDIAREMQARSYSIYWSFDEKSFKAVHNADERLTHYITVQAL